ncbi:MAG: hydroxymethylbilane synthase [Hyphomicrobium sp.]
MQARTIRIGTRGSPLALAQAHETRTRLMAAHGLPESRFEICIIKTTGDMILDRPLSEAGGKGLFTKEIEDALIARDIDLAVHSMKDVQTALPDSLMLAAIFPREDVRDAFISLKYRSISELPQGARVGTSSLRRQAQIKRMRPDLDVVGFRGNVQTRLKKLEDGVADATFLACAGLNRLGYADRIAERIPTEVMLPAVAQGAIGIECSADYTEVRALLAPLHHAASGTCVEAERTFLARLEGSCRTPIAGLAELGADGRLSFRGEILSPDGREHHATSRSGATGDITDVAMAAAEDLLSRASPDIFRALV